MAEIGRDFMDTKRMVRAGIIAALYVALIAIFPGTSFLWLQVRPAEALTVLPIIYPEAVPGLFVGCLVSNFLFGGLGPIDIIGGSLTTLLAAYVTYRYRKSIVAYLSPVIFNGLIVSAYLTYLIGEHSYLGFAATIASSEALVVFALGVPLVKALKRANTKYLK